MSEFLLSIFITVSVEKELVQPGKMEDVFCPMSTSNNLGRFRMIFFNNNNNIINNMDENKLQCAYEHLYIYIIQIIEVNMYLY